MENKRVWVCNPFSNEAVYADYLGVGDAPEDRNARIRVSTMNRLGRVVSVSELPPALQAMEDPAPPLKPYAYISGQIPLVSPDLATLLGTLDLGDGQIHPTTFVDAQGHPLPHRHLFWNFGNRKCGLLPEACLGLLHYKPIPERNILESYALRGRLKDDDLAVGTSVFSGPDVWVDPLIADLVFFSGRFEALMHSAGLRDLFDLKSARVE